MQSCRMTLDEHPGYNPHAVPFCLEQPFSMPGEQTFRQRQLAEKNPLLRLEPGFETSQTFTMLFETALDKALRDMENWRRGNNLQPLLGPPCGVLLQGGHTGRGSCEADDYSLLCTGGAANGTYYGS